MAGSGIGSPNSASDLKQFYLERGGHNRRIAHSRHRFMALSAKGAALSLGSRSLTHFYLRVSFGRKCDCVQSTNAENTFCTVECVCKGFIRLLMTAVML